MLGPISRNIEWRSFGWFHADSMARPKTKNYDCDFFYGSLFLLMEPKFHSLTLSSNNSCSKPHTANKFHIFRKLWTYYLAFTWSYLGYFFFEQILTTASTFSLSEYTFPFCFPFISPLFYSSLACTSGV